MANNDIKVKDLSDTSNITTSNKMMVLTDDVNNTVQNITIEDLITNITSSDANNAITSGTDKKLFTPDLSGEIGDLADLDTTDKTSIVNAINEILQEPVSSDLLHSLKGYLDNGTLLTNAELYKDVYNYNHSTYGFTSKFTVVGTPTITADGIASGFSGSNYLTISNAATLDKTTYFTIHVAFTTPAAWGAQGGRFWTHDSSNEVGHTTAGKLSGKFLGQDINNSSLSALDLNTSYKAYFIYDNTGWYVKYKKDTDDTWITSTKTTITSASSVSLTTQTIGKEGGGYPFLGSIDLKSITFWLNGYPTFTGTQTEIDTIKSNNYTVTGTPSITADGVASGLDTSNYITCNCINTDGTVIIPVPNVASSYGGEAVTGAYKVYKGSSWENRWDLIIDTSNTTIVSIGFSSYGGINYETTKLLIKVIKLGYDYTVYLKIDDNDWILRGTYTKSVNPTATNLKFEGGYNLDLNAYKNIVNGAVTNQPCLLIPYSKSSTGSKIVDVAYRGRVQDVYEQYGKALYYTIDEINQNVTLPMGEVYGNILAATKKHFPTPDYVNGITITSYPYTSPANGYIDIVSATIPTNTLDLGASINGVNVAEWFNYSNTSLSVSGGLYPVKKGDVFIMGTPTSTVRFLYYVEE